MSMIESLAFFNRTTTLEEVDIIHKKVEQVPVLESQALSPFGNHEPGMDMVSCTSISQSPPQAKWG